MRIKGKIYGIKLCKISYIIWKRYGSETLCLRENEVAILRKAERYMVRAMFGVKLVDKRWSCMMDMLELKEAADNLTKANSMSWYGHVLRRPEKDVLMKAIVHEENGKRKQGRTRMKWREQVEGSMRRIGLRKEDAADLYRWREGVRIAEVGGCIRPPPVTGY